MDTNRFNGSREESLFDSENESSGVDNSENVKENTGDLAFKKYTAGGLGRHLGVFSTTSLV